MDEMKDLQSSLAESEAEKLALDQTLVEYIKANVKARKEINLLIAQVNNLSSKVSAMSGEKEDLILKVKDLQSSLDVLRPDVGAVILDPLP